MSYYYTIQQELRETGVAIFEGVKLRVIRGKDHGAALHPGDMYVAERNSGPKLLTVRRVNLTGGWVEAVENAYSFDLHECVGVEFDI